MKVMGVVEAKIQTVERLPAGLGCRGEQASDCGQLSRTPAAVWPTQAGRKQGRRVACVISTAGKAKADFSRRVRRPTRCIVLEKLERVKLLENRWHTAANHSRPASCVVNADIDAEDYPERDPQKGH